MLEIVYSLSFIFVNPFYLVHICIDYVITFCKQKLQTFLRFNQEVWYAIRNNLKIMKVVTGIVENGKEILTIETVVYRRSK